MNKNITVSISNPTPVITILVTQIYHLSIEIWEMSSSGLPENIFLSFLVGLMNLKVCYMMQAAVNILTKFQVQ